MALRTMVLRLGKGVEQQEVWLEWWVGGIVYRVLDLWYQFLRLRLGPLNNMVFISAQIILSLFGAIT